MFETFSAISFFLYIIFSLIFTGIFVCVVLIIIKSVHRQFKIDNNEINVDGNNTSVNIGGFEFSVGQKNDASNEKDVACTYCGAKHTKDETVCKNCGAVLK